MLRSRKISYWKAKLCFVIFYSCLVGIFWYFKLPCVFVHFLGIPCPGCGMTRAVVSALHLDWQAAFFDHPMFWSMPFVALYCLFDHGVFGIKKLDNCILALIGIGFFVQWVWKIVYF